MVFDSEISLDVDISTILDVMLYDNTSSDVVISVLSQNEKSLTEIWRNSDCYEKIFQLDYFLKSSEYAKGWIISHLQKIPIKTAAFLCWQACSCSSPLSEAEKASFRKNFDWILRKTTVSHPYSGFKRSFALPVDEWIFSKIESGMSFPDIIAEMPMDVFSAMAYTDSNWVNSSLFQARVYQLDVFDALDEAKQWILVKNLCRLDLKMAMRAVSQILQSHLPSELKEMCFRNVAEMHHSYSMKALLESMFKGNSAVIKALSSTSFDIVQVELAMIGNGNYSLKKIILYYVIKNDVKMLKKWWSEYNDEVSEVYDLSFLDNFQ